MAKIFSQKDGAIRLYDSTLTPYYLEIPFAGGDLTCPLGRNQAEERLILNNGKFDANAHYIEGSDAQRMEPIGMSFSALYGSQATQGYLIDFISALSDGGTTTVNANTIVTTKGDNTIDSITLPGFANSNMMTCDVEILWDDGASDKGFKLAEVFFPLAENTVQNGEDSVVLQLSGMIYGPITRITAFTSGTDITA